MPRLTFHIRATTRKPATDSVAHTSSLLKSVPLALPVPCEVGICKQLRTGRASGTHRISATFRFSTGCIRSQIYSITSPGPRSSARGRGRAGSVAATRISPAINTASATQKLAVRILRGILSRWLSASVVTQRFAPSGTELRVPGSVRFSIDAQQPGGVVPEHVFDLRVGEAF